MNGENSLSAELTTEVGWIWDLFYAGIKEVYMVSREGFRPRPDEVTCLSWSLPNSPVAEGLESHCGRIYGIL